MNFTPDQIKAYELFHPHIWNKTMQRLSSQERFVHYTNAEAAVSMIKNNQVWMRKASLMNDFMEIEHGLECLNHSYTGEAGAHFRKVIDDLFPDLSRELENLINGWIPDFRTGTFLTSLSEHNNYEDENGRLSMWRAYGGNTGVGLVLNPHVFLTATDALRAYTSPVSYFTPDEFKVEFDAITNNLKSETSFLKSFGRESVLGHLFAMFRFAAICTKHPGFSEEKEWRIIYSPSLEKSQQITEEIISLNGVPQTICKIPLVDIPDENLIGAEIPSLIDRIIVGPNEHANEVSLTLTKLLDKAGMKDPASKVIISGIPLRA